ncbi:hypothetical protein [Cupriavidus sp.]|jgi:hypothetical protein|uniref:hypothetical protein n=1 Tax=Cupriavidus sp. TaxID=1873897 RepID=UPI0025B98028|nr:hypothetical protein [Cupriavidus sp.]MCA3190932.1 hypothetical protein [Cupriavidus sp.]MCA3199276.1 hypothetical protein [Cupriavidus sp.]MCA3204543.1 hypothetical protein [Cupriavidus sp.]MCA3209863.1 hypothetical protein [Cupriavidus sp.]MCA3235888.1 hypothetical protein [Cupriavidus sp.]
MTSKIMNALGNPFVRALMDALGLPKHTISFEMRCAVNEVVTIRCSYHPQADAAEGFDARPLLANYKLVPASAATEGDPAEAFADGDPEQQGGFIVVDGSPQSVSIPVLVMGAVGMLALGAALAYAFRL